MTLTIYTDDYDEFDGLSKGMSGHVFLDPNGPSETGAAWRRLSEAMTDTADRRIDEICICYRDRKQGQMFRKFAVNNEKLPSGAIG